MKKRLIAILLCLATVVSFAVPGTLAFGETVGAQLFLDGAAVSEASFPVNEKLTLAVGSGTDGACQWQLYIPGIDAWVNIQGQTGVTCNVSYAMLSNALDGNGQAKIRASVDTGSGLVYSNEAVITPEEAGQSNDASAMLKAVRPSASQNSTANTTTPSVSDEELDALFAEADRAEAAKGVASAKAGAANAELQQAQARYNAALAAVNANPAADLEKAQADFDSASAALSAAQAQYDAANAALSAAQAANDVNAATAAAANVQSATAALAQANSSYNVASAALSSAQAAANAAGDSSTAQAELDAATAALDEAKAKAEAAKAELEAAEAAYAKADAALNAALEGSGNTDSSTYETSTEGSGEQTVPNKYSVVINYQFANGSVAANPWTSTLAAGSELKQTVKSPDVLGYTPDRAEVTFDIAAVEGDVIETVTYNPAIVEYEVRHYLQNLDDDKYALHEIVKKTGHTESMVGDSLAESYEGFYSLLYDTETTIAADGSTFIEIYYDRYYYLMNFDLDGGYGVEPIYARYGAPVSAGTPTKAGYTFTGWSPEMTYTTMPATNTKFTAQWTAGNTTYDVVFWYENADDDLYSQAGVLEDVSAVAGAIVNGSIYQSHNFTGRDSSHFTYSHADENVEVKGDGTTVVNVYFSRNVYTLYFRANGLCGLEEHSHDNCAITCALTEHEHSSACCSRNHDHRYNCNTNNCVYYGYEHEHSNGCYDCGKIEHTHGNNCNNSNRQNTVKTITAKYESKISHYFPIVTSTGTSYSGYSWTDSSGDTYSYALQTLDIMPGNDVTFEGEDRGTDCVIYYYVEIVSNESLEGDTITTFNGKTYKLFKSVEHSFNFITYDEEYHPIEGFSRNRSYASPGFGTYDGSQDRAKLGSRGNGYDHVNYLYYDRLSYKLTFSNNGETVSGKGGLLQYEAPLTDHYFVPNYPTNLEPDAYVFEGWYESPFFGDTKVNFETAKMPANDVTLYARWVPKNHNVNIYLTSKMNAEDKIGETQVVAHREFAKEPGEPENGAYTFVGWFYMDGSTEKAFDFSMPVTQDLDLYAKWSSNILMEYTIKYETADGKTVAKTETGSALAGTTKTFEAKAGEQLNEGYRTGYFPETNSHSITIDIEDPSKNEFTFIYVPKTEVPYVVKYLEYGTSNVLHEQKDAKTRDAIITEDFVPVPGYMPNAYQQRLVLSADEKQNEIIFWYTKDDDHAPVFVVHYIQNAVGDDYTVYQESTDLNGVIDQSYDVQVINIPGFDYDHATKKNGEDGEIEAVEAVNGTVTGTVTKYGLKLELYYNRELHPYEFRFLEKGTDKVLAVPVTDTARYDAQVTQPAKIIPYYTVDGEANHSITIAREEGDTAVKNVRTFYYVENEVNINYVAVGPEGVDFGGVSLDTEKIKVLSGTAEGSTATPAENFRLVGWYTDEACTQKVTDADGTVDASGKFVPAKKTDKDDPEKTYYVADTYYAKFEYNLTTLTITKDVNAGPGKGPDGFIFDVYEVNSDGSLDMVATVAISGKGSTTIHGLTVGKTYKVVENSAWSCWYSASYGDNNPITLAASGNEVKVNNTYSNENILHGGHSVTNRNPVGNN